MDALITEGIKNGQHLYQVIQANQLDIPLSTAYRYFAKGYFFISSLALPRKVTFRPRKKQYQDYVPRGVKVGRCYEDFQAYIKENEISQWVEMDTVLGKPGGKVVLTLDFTICNFMCFYLLESKAACGVVRTFNELRTAFTANGLSFKSYFPLILTDNGGEFSCVDAIEHGLDGSRETRLFFCEPMKSYQKPRVEKNHTLFRDICPKGTSFDDFMQEKLALRASLWVKNATFPCNQAILGAFDSRLGSGMQISEHTRYTISIMFWMFRNPYVLRIISLILLLVASILALLRPT